MKRKFKIGASKEPIERFVEQGRKRHSVRKTPPLWLTEREPRYATPSSASSSTLWPPAPSKLRIHAISRGITPPIVMYVKGWPSWRKREGRVSGNNARVNVQVRRETPFRSPPLSNYTFLSFGVYVCQRYCAAMRYIIDETLTVTVGTRPFRGNFKDNGHVLRLDGTEVAIVEP